MRPGYFKSGWVRRMNRYKRQRLGLKKTPPNILKFRTKEEASNVKNFLINKGYIRVRNIKSVKAGTQPPTSAKGEVERKAEKLMSPSPDLRQTKIGRPKLKGEE